MLQEQFYMRVALLIAFGIVYVKSYINMAVRNSKETEPVRHLILRILGGFLAILAIIFGGMSIYMITQIPFPNEAIGPFLTPNTIIRRSNQTMYWGYATFPQSQCFSMIVGFFEFLALSAYCFMFKSSHSKWYSKVGKIIFCIFFYMFFVSATDFHYFDIYEWTAPILFVVMVFIAGRNKKNKHTNAMECDIATNSDLTTLQNEKSVESIPYTEDNPTDIPNFAENDILMNNNSKNAETEYSPTGEALNYENDFESDAEDNQRPTIEDRPEPEVRFCRHCGEKIDYQIVKFCKYCGKQLN